MPLSWMLDHMDNVSGEQTIEDISNVIHLSGRFIYPDDFTGNKSFQIKDVPL
jgi:hypothetical protein